MKKVLLAGTAIIGMALVSTPAVADLNLDLGGLFRGYVVNVDDDQNNLRETDFRRDAEIHFTGETTLDNGLTVGIHYENVLGDEIGINESDEVYAYFSGSWGRVNFGSEDAASYLLQVAAPSADSNIDGLRTYIQGFSSAPATGAGANPFGSDTLAFGVVTDPGGAVAVDNDISTFAGTATPLDNALIDYDHADFSNTDRFTYLSPKFSGFQAGFSYAPENGQNSIVNNVAAMAADNNVAGNVNFTADALTVVTTAGAAQAYEDLWEIAARWDGEYEGFGLSFGAGYSTADLEAPGAPGAVAAGNAGDTAITDGFDTWNVGGNVAFAGFSFGANYMEQSTEYTGIVNDAVNGAAALTGDIDRETWVVGAGWDNGPYHLGISYLEQTTDIEGVNNLDAVAAAADVAIAGAENDVEKITLGGGYTFGPGMTFRGAVSWGEYDVINSANAGVNAAFSRTTNDFTQVTLGTDIQF